MSTDQLTSVKENYSKHRHIVKLAYEQGYHVNVDGVAYGKSGKQLSIKQQRNPESYPSTTVYIEVDGKKDSYSIRLHMLAAYSFYGDELFKPGVVVRHLDGNRLNLSRKNIVLGTPKDNENDKSAEQRSQVAKKREATKKTLSDEQANEIRQRVSNGERQYILAKEYGVSQQMINNIIKMRTHV